MFERMLRAFRHKNYKLYFFGQGVSLVGNWLTYVAMSWTVYRLTRESQSEHTALLLGVVGFAGQFPMLVFAPIAGVFVDRWNRWTILVATTALSMLQTAALAVLSLTGLISIAQIIGLSLFQGVVDSFDTPTRQAFLVEIIEERKDLSNAIALNSSLFNGARLIGPAVAGWLIAAVGEGYCFAIDTLGYVAVFAALFAMSLRHVSQGSERRPAVHEFKEGIRYALGSPPILSATAMVGLVCFLATPLTVLMPIFADRLYPGHGARTLGFLMAAQGCGALAGAVYLTTRKTVLGLGRVMAIASVALGIELIAFVSSTSFWLRMLCMVVGGLGLILVMASGNTFVQTIVHDKKRGRVMSLYTTVVMGVAPFGSLVAGALATPFGEAYTIMGAGVGCILAGLVFRWALPALRVYVRPIYLEKGIITSEMSIGNQAAKDDSARPD